MYSFVCKMDCKWTTLNKQTNKQTNITFVNLRGASIRFLLRGFILSLKISFYKMALGISQSISHFGIFITNNKKGIFQCALRILPKKKIEQSNNQVCTHKGLLCHAYTMMFFQCLLKLLKSFYLPCLGR